MSIAEQMGLLRCKPWPHARTARKFWSSLHDHLAHFNHVGVTAGHLDGSVELRVGFASQDLGKAVVLFVGNWQLSPADAKVFAARILQAAEAADASTDSAT